METAKVDIRKLQLLNDSINRTIDALNQVRLSVHGAGLSHTAPIGVPPYAAFTSPFGIAPQVAPQQMLGMFPGVGVTNMGLGHTAAAAYYQNPNLLQQAAWTNPWTSAFATNPFGTNPFATNPFYTQNGLAHSGVEAFAYNDPYATARIAQTFPFVNWGYSPFVWPNA